MVLIVIMIFMDSPNGADGLSDERRAAVRAIVVRERVATQAEIARRLGARGFPVSQPAVSQDLRALGAVKQSGRWRLPPSPFAGIGRLVDSFEPAGPHVLVVRTLPGGAQRVGHAIDTADWPECAGSVAGDDTVFVASRNGAQQARLVERFHAAFGPGAEAARETGPETASDGAP